MGDATETGFKWWMRYVIVPLLGGAGVLGIWIAYITRPPADLGKPSSPAVASSVNQIPVESKKPEPEKPQLPIEVTPSVQPSEKVHSRPPRVNTHAAANKQADDPVVIPEQKSIVPAPEADRTDLVKFYIRDRDGAKVTNKSLSFEHLDNFSITWDATAIAAKGPIRMVWGTRGSQYPGREEENSGEKHLVCRGLKPLNFKLLQTLADGTTRQLGELDIDCEK